MFLVCSGINAHKHECSETAFLVPFKDQFNVEDKSSIATMHIVCFEEGLCLEIIGIKLVNQATLFIKSVQ